MRRLAAAAVIVVSPTAVLGGAYAGERLATGEAGAEEIAAEVAWTTRVNALCREREEAADRLAKPRTRAELLRYARALREIGLRHDGRVLALRVPRRFQADVDLIWADQPELYRLLDEYAGAVAAGDEQKAARLERLGDKLEERGKKVLKRLGLDACAP